MENKFYCPTKSGTGGVITIGYSYARNDCYLGLLNQTGFDPEKQEGIYLGGEDFLQVLREDELTGLYYALSNKDSYKFKSFRGIIRYVEKNLEINGKMVDFKYFSFKIKDRVTEYYAAVPMDVSTRICFYIEFLMDKILNKSYSQGKNEFYEKNPELKPPSLAKKKKAEKKPKEDDGWIDEVNKNSVKTMTQEPVIDTSLDF